MLEIKGRFLANLKKTSNGLKLLQLCNSEKDNEGNENKTYYTAWINEKLTHIINKDLLDKIEESYAIVDVEGYLKVTKKGQYTNLTIFPSSIIEYSR